MSQQFASEKARKLIEDDIEPKLDDIEDKLDNSSHGLAALRALIDAVEAKLDNTELLLKLPSDPVVDAIAAAGDQNTTEMTITLPVIAGATIRRAMVACFLTAINKTATAHQLDVTQQARVAAGAWGNYFSCLDYIGFPAVQNATTGDVPMSEVSALVNAWGATYGFRLTVNQSGGANNIRYKTQYLMVLTYRMS